MGVIIEFGLIVDLFVYLSNKGTGRTGSVAMQDISTSLSCGRKFCNEANQNLGAYWGV